MQPNPFWDGVGGGGKNKKSARYKYTAAAVRRAGDCEFIAAFKAQTMNVLGGGQFLDVSAAAASWPINLPRTIVYLQR